MKTIRELIEEKGRGVIEAMIAMINETPQAYALLSKAGQELLGVLLKENCILVLLDDGWKDKPAKTTFNNSRTYRVRKDYELPKDEPEVFWGEKEYLHQCPCYSCPDDKHSYWDELTRWAEENGWEFHGFHKSKDVAEMPRRPYLPFYCQNNGKVCVRPFAKFVKAERKQ